MKIIYVAGPYTAPTHIGVERNVLDAKEAAIELLRKGWAVVCPHTMTFGCEIGTGLPEQVFYQSDLAILARCDAICMIGDWRASKGSVGEYSQACADGLTIYVGTAEVPEASE